MTLLKFAALVLTLVPVSAQAQALCSLRSCKQACKDAATLCAKGAKATKTELVQDCKLTLEGELTQCAVTQTNDTLACEGTCGTELKRCLKNAVAAFKVCRKTAKMAFKQCRHVTKGEAKAAKAACSQASRTCKLACAGALPPSPTPIPTRSPTVAPTPTPAPTRNPICGLTRNSTIEDKFGASFTLSVHNPCSSDLVLEVEIAPLAGTIFFCGADMAFLQAGIFHESDEFVVARNTAKIPVCEDFRFPTSNPLVVITTASSDLDFTQPFSVFYMGQAVADFP